MAFFKQFPTLLYDLNKDGKNVEVKDIFRFIDVNEKLIDPASAYQKYYIKDGERPDHVSVNLYKNPDYYWTFFIINDSLKEGYDSWPSSYNQLQRNITRNYQPYSVLESSPPDNTIVSNYNSSPRTHYIGFEADSPTDKNWSPAISVGKVYKVDTSRNQVWIENPTQRLTNHIGKSGHGKPTIRFYQSNGEKNSPAISFRKGFQYAWQAPYEYQGVSNSPKTFYEAISANATSNPLTYRQYEEESNDLKNEIRVIKPEFIAEFTELYKRLLRA